MKWVKSSEKLPPETKAGELLVYTHAGEYKLCGFDGQHFYYFYVDGDVEMTCNLSIHGAPFWLALEPPNA